MSSSGGCVGGSGKGVAVFHRQWMDGWIVAEVLETLNLLDNKLNHLLTGGPLTHTNNNHIFK
jgi:hypothetical protein